MSCNFTYQKSVLAKFKLHFKFCKAASLYDHGIDASLKARLRHLDAIQTSGQTRPSQRSISGGRAADQHPDSAIPQRDASIRYNCAKWIRDPELDFSVLLINLHQSLLRQLYIALRR